MAFYLFIIKPMDKYEIDVVGNCKHAPEFSI